MHLRTARVSTASTDSSRKYRRFRLLLTRSVYHYEPVAPGSAPGIRETDRDADGRRALAMALFINGETDEPLP